jgi:hypothetical protein
MSGVSVHCPYCNGQFPAPYGASPGTRIACPRCGERFACRAQDVSEAMTSAPLTPSNEEASPAYSPPTIGDGVSTEPHGRPRVSNRVIALMVLGVMLLMAVLGGVYAWRTVVLRRDYDWHLPKTQALDVPLIARVALGAYVVVLVLAVLRGWNRRERSTGASTGRGWLGHYGTPALAVLVLIGVGLALVAIQQRPVRGPTPNEPSGPESVPAALPSELAALGYLPDGVHLVIGLHVAEAWRTPAGRQFLDGSRPGSVFGPEQIEALTGLRPAEIDHAIIAVKLDQVLPRVFFIVRTIHPYNLGEILDSLGRPTKLPSTDGRTLYEFRLKNTQLILWPADERTLVVGGWPEGDLKDVPLKPRDGLDHLPADLRTLLTNNLDTAARQAPAQLWVAAHADDLGKLPASVALGFLLKDSWPVVKNVQSLAAWVQLGDDADIRAVAHCSDSAAAEALNDFLRPMQPGKGLPALFPKDSPLAAELVRTAQIERGGDWLSLDARISAAALHKPQGNAK